MLSHSHAQTHAGALNPLLTQFFIADLIQLNHFRSFHLFSSHFLLVPVTSSGIIGHIPLSTRILIALGVLNWVSY